MNREDKKEQVWEKADKIRGKDPKKYRKDPYGNEIYKNSYGKDSTMGWDIDHIKPKSKGGSDNIRNLQALHHSTNVKKSDSLKKKSRHNQK